jgi:hypothetical protein
VHPEHRLCLGGVDPDVEDRVAVLDVVDAARLAIAAEGLLQRLTGRRGAEARIAVEVIRSDPATGDERKRVVVLEEQLSARVEAQGAAALGREQLPSAIHDQVHRLVPARPLQLSLTTHERMQQAIGRVVRLPAIQSLRAEPAAIDPIDPASANADDPAVADTDVERAAVRAEDAGRLNPALDYAVDSFIHTDRPIPAPRIRSPYTPRVGDPAAHDPAGTPRPTGGRTGPLGEPSRARPSRVTMRGRSTTHRSTRSSGSRAAVVSCRCG